MTDPLLSLRAAELTLGGRVLWRDLDLDVAPGEFVAVLGANGSGKTSLLKTILGQPRLSAGTATLVAWFAQTFLQLVLLSIIMVGQKVAAEKSDKQLEQTYYDAEALLQISDDMHKLVKQNVELTGQMNVLLGQNTELTEQINKLICKTGKG